MSSLTQSISVFSQAMNMRTQRHQVLASNIANADTPQYKARDFSFKEAMQGSMSGRSTGGGVTLATTSAGHMRGDGVSASAVMKFRNENQSSADGNTVDMDVERSEITENALQYQILTQLISQKFQGMRTALSSTQG